MSKQEINQEILRKVWTECEEEIVEMLQKKMEEALEKSEVLTQEKPPFEVKVPRLEDLIGKHYINEDGEVLEVTAGNVIMWAGSYLRGLIFNSKEEAERYDNERLLLFKIKKWAEIQNGGWKAGVDDGKYFIYYSNNDGQISTSFTTYCNYFAKLPYFKTREIAQACIDEFGDEILEVLVNEGN